MRSNPSLDGRLDLDVQRGPRAAADAAIVESQRPGLTLDVGALDPRGNLLEGRLQLIEPVRVTGQRRRPTAVAPQESAMLGSEPDGARAEPSLQVRAWPAAHQHDEEVGQAGKRLKEVHEWRLGPGEIRAIRERYQSPVEVEEEGKR
jgi:hypothetical protein